MRGDKKMNKGKRITRVGAALVAAISAVCVVLFPTTAYAWGPSRDTYTIENPASHNVFNSITDNPDYGDERNFLRVRDSDSK